MTKALFILPLFLVLAACGTPEVKTKKESEKSQDYFIAEEDIFSGDKIQQYLKNELKFTKEANIFFLKGLDMFKNQKNLDSAQHYFVESILKEPLAKTYYELGNVLMEAGDYDNSLLAYGLAEQLGFEPYSKILYNKACAYSLMEDMDMAGQYLEYSLQAGYTNLDNINKDPDLEYLRKTYAFERAINNGLKGMSEPEKLFWLQFKRLFPKMEKPLIIDPINGPLNIANLETISYDFEKYIAEMRDDKFSREVSKGFYYYAVLTENDEYVALVYIVRDEYMGESAPLTYRLATFNHQGKLIDKREIAGGLRYDEPYRVAEIDNKLNITIDLMEAKYEKDPQEEGYYENKIIGSKKVGSESFKLGGNGMIIETSNKEVAINEEL